MLFSGFLLCAKARQEGRARSARPVVFFSLWRCSFPGSLSCLPCVAASPRQQGAAKTWQSAVFPAGQTPRWFWCWQQPAAAMLGAGEPWSRDAAPAAWETRPELQEPCRVSAAGTPHAGPADTRRPGMKRKCCPCLPVLSSSLVLLLCALLCAPSVGTLIFLYQDSLFHFM